MKRKKKKIQWDVNSLRMVFYIISLHIVINFVKFCIQYLFRHIRTISGVLDINKLIYYTMIGRISTKAIAIKNFEPVTN